MSTAVTPVERAAGGAGRGLGLHLRGRRAGAALGGLVLFVIAARGLVELAPDLAQTVLVVLAPLLAVSLLGSTLAGEDPELERSSARLTGWFRTGHLVLGLGCTAAVLAAAAVGPLAAVDVEATGRNLLGFAGLAALAATVLGARLAWTAPCAWGLVAITAGPQSEPQKEALAWPAQTPGTTPTLIALGLAAAGALTYAQRHTPR